MNKTLQERKDKAIDEAYKAYMEDLKKAQEAQEAHKKAIDQAMQTYKEAREKAETL